MDKLLQYARDEKRSKLRKTLRQLNDMIGMSDVKESVAQQVQRYIMNDIFQKSVNKTSATNITTRSKTRFKRQSIQQRKKRKRSKHNWTHKKSKRQQQTHSRERSESKNSIELNEEAGLAFLKMIIASNRAEQRNTDNAMPLLQLINNNVESDYDSDEDSDSEEEDDKEEDYDGFKFHTLLLGPPGCGKTTLARKIADVWEAAGIVNGQFKAIGRTHVMSKWQGEASEKIRDAIEETRGGVLFVDECYGLVQGSNDTYGNEVLTAIVQAMTDKKCGTTFIFAGYEKDVKSKIFSANAGLERRFDAIYKISVNDPLHLAKIFMKLNKDDEWSVLMNTIDIHKLFESNKSDIKFGGADAESIAEEARREHMDRFFPNCMDRRLTENDIKNGMKKFLKKKASHRTKIMCTNMFL